MTTATISVTSLVAFLLAVIPALYRLMQPFLQARILKERDLHTQRQLELLDYLASIAVAEMANLKDLSHENRKKAAIRLIIEQLAALSTKISKATISASVESAYQFYKHQLRGDNHR